MKIKVNTDGGARGNPGPAAIGIVIQLVEPPSSYIGDNPVTIGKFLGHQTNNIAEYSAVLVALQYLAGMIPETKTEISSIEFYLDSNLVVQQLNRLFKIKNNCLFKLYMEIEEMERRIGDIKITYNYVPREQNKAADLIVNQVLDRAFL